MKADRYIATPEDRAAALAWVMSTKDLGNWGERWICAAKALAVFDPKRGQLSHLLARIWRRRRIDLGRRENYRGAMQLEEEYANGLTVRDRRRDEEVPAAVMRGLTDEMHLFVRGQPYEAIAKATGVRLGTLKSRLHRDRRMLMETLGERA